jgi:hypothetical protein
VTDMSEDLILKLVLAIIGSNAFFSFLQFVITRQDNKKGIEKQIKRISQKIDENSAVLARTHILRFSDELKNGIEHSAEYFRQQLDDCDTYERYCDKNPDFKNSYTMVANKYIKETFERLTKEGKI